MLLGTSWFWEAGAIPARSRRCNRGVNLDLLPLGPWVWEGRGECRSGSQKTDRERNVGIPPTPRGWRSDGCNNRSRVGADADPPMGIRATCAGCGCALTRQLRGWRRFPGDRPGESLPARGVPRRSPPSRRSLFAATSASIAGEPSIEDAIAIEAVAAEAHPEPASPADHPDEAALAMTPWFEYPPNPPALGQRQPPYLSRRRRQAGWTEHRRIAAVLTLGMAWFVAEARRPAPSPV